MIDAAIREVDEEPMQRSIDLSNRESDAYQQLYAEILAEVDGEDPRVSKASQMQMCEALAARGIASVLITFPLNAVNDFKGLDGVEFGVSFPDEYMDQSEVIAAVRMTYGMMLNMAEEQ